MSSEDDEDEFSNESDEEQVDQNNSNEQPDQKTPTPVKSKPQKRGTLTTLVVPPNKPFTAKKQSIGAQLQMIKTRRKRRIEQWSQESQWFNPEKTKALKDQSCRHPELKVELNQFEFHGPTQVEIKDRIRYLKPPTVNNFVVSMNVGCEVNLDEIARNLKNCEYDPLGPVPGVTLRLRDPKCSAKITYKDQTNLRVTGCADEYSARVATRMILRKLQKMGYPVRFNDFRMSIQHSSAWIGFNVDLQKFADHKGLSYEPDLANIGGGLELDKDPGYNDGKLNYVKIFKSGRINFLGPIKSRTDLHTSYAKLYTELFPFRRERETPPANLAGATLSLTPDAEVERPTEDSVAPPVTVATIPELDDVDEEAALDAHFEI